MTNHHPLPRFRRALGEDSGNCFLYGCVTLVVLVLLAGLIGFLGIRYVAREFREKYTDTAPVELPTVEMAQPEIDALVERVDRYAKDLRDDEPLESITLTQDEINALLQNHPDLKETYGDHMYVELGDNTVTAQMSLPLDWLPLFRNRFFNGKATFDVGFMAGKFQIYLNAATVKGEDIPREQLRPYRRENFGEIWEENPDSRSLTKRIESVAVKSTGITIVPVKKKGETESAAEAPAAAEPSAPDEAAPAEPETPAADPANAA